MVFVADDVGAWLVGLLADAGRKKLTTLALGDEQQRALRHAATSAVLATAVDLGRVARGISAPGPHRSVLDSLPSHGSCHPVHQE